MKNVFRTSLSIFFLLSVLTAYALPTMAGRLKSYNSATGIMVLELDDKSERSFKLTAKTEVELMGRAAAPGSLRQGAKVSVQIAGALNVSPLKAAKIVDWSNSEKIVAQGAVSPYYTPVSQYPSTDGGGGVPDGAPKMNTTAHQDMAAIGQGGSQNQPKGPVGEGQYNNSQSQGTPQMPSYQNNSGNYINQGQSMTAPLEGMGIDPYSNSNYNPGMNNSSYTQMGSNDIGNVIVGGDEDGEGHSSDMMNNGMESAYGGSNQRMTGRVMQSSIEQGFVVIQSFEHPTLQRILLQQVADAPMQLLVDGQMIEVIGSPSPQGFRATEIKAASGY